MARKLRYNEEEGGMAKAQLQKIEAYAAKLNEMIHPEDELEGWVQNKLAVVAAYMGDVKHYLDYELKKAFGEGGGVSMKERHWEVEFTWEGADDEGRKVNVMADSVSEAEKKVKEKFGPYYKGMRIVEVEEDKEMTWDEYAKQPKKVFSKGYADGGDIEIDPGEEIDRVYEAVREQSINDYLDRKEGRGGKAFVEITKPTDLKTKAVADKIKDLIDMGYRSADILLKMAFVTSDKVEKELGDQFKILKNQVFLKNALDFKKFARGGGIGDVIMKHQGSTVYEDMQEAKEHLGADIWNKFSLEEKIAVTEYLKAQGHIGYFGEEEDLTTLAAMQYKKGGRS